jgi:predicted ATPase
MTGAPITTPDRRVRVFVSSTLTELAEDRQSAKDAITRLHMTPVMFEIGARTHPARDLYRAYLEQSDVFVGIYGQSYGWLAPTEAVSGLEDEYALSGDRPKLIYVKTLPARDPRLTALLDRVQNDNRVAYKHYEHAEDLVELLANDLAVLLTERFAAGPPSSSSPSLALPVPTPTSEAVGREATVATVLALVSDPAVRLVTLIGPGGIGKTRLALEVAKQVLSKGDASEVSFVDLAPVTDPGLWQVSVAASLGIQTEGQRPMLEVITDRLRSRRLLLVLDNVEQLVSAADDLVRLMASCPELTVLVTSRIALRVRGEHEVEVPPLRLPEPDGDIGAIGRSPAVRLLVERAQQVRPEFRLTESNARSTAALARLLDGIPLALELAAAQLRLLTPAALVRRLTSVSGRSLDLVADTVDVPRRQRTLRTTIEWSHSLLGEAERALFARVSVFVGAWTLEAMAAVGTVDDDLDSFDVLSSLLTQSLVRTDDSDPDEPRFRMLGTIRTYAAERLVERGEVESTTRRLTEYLFEVVNSVRDDLQGADHLKAASRLDRERDEIFSAIGVALRDDDADAVGRLLTPLFTYWWSRGLLSMTNDLAERAAALPSAARLDRYGSALLSGARGMSLIMVGRLDEAEGLLGRTLDDATAIGNDRLRGYALLGLGGSLGHHDVTGASSLLERAADVFHLTGDDWGLALSLSTWGSLLLVRGDATAARSMHLDALAAANRIRNDMLRAQILGMLGLDAMGAHDLPSARGFYASAVQLHLALDDYEGSAYCLFGLAEVARALGRPEVAATLVGASRQARNAIGAVTWPSVQSSEAAQDEQLSRALGADDFAALTAEGGAMRVSDALEYGLHATEAAPTPAART